MRHCQQHWLLASDTYGQRSTYKADLAPHTIIIQHRTSRDPPHRADLAQRACKSGRVVIEGNPPPATHAVSPARGSHMGCVWFQSTFHLRQGGIMSEELVCTEVGILPHPATSLHGLASYTKAPCPDQRTSVQTKVTMPQAEL